MLRLLYKPRQDHIPVLVRLERAAQDIVRYLPDKVRFFSEVVWVMEYMSLSRMIDWEIIALNLSGKEVVATLSNMEIKRQN